MAIIKINHFLHKKTTPLISFAIKKICYRIGSKIGCNVLLILIKSLIHEQKHFAFMGLSRKKKEFTPKSRFTRDKKAKLHLLEKFAAIKKLNMVSNRKFHLDPLKLKLLLSFIR